ncbi:interaptin-like [Epinephelus moara]|uniref:interaptin-like n=1 Tax=Epinephelus moara TaxID=300413 RepID=UPI00214E413E|nr:interaptin-like [Epinephelus moara]
MFTPPYRSSSPFSLTDLDMWDTKSRFSAQTSAWCGMATVSGTGFLSKVSTSTSGSTGGFRQDDPGLKKWQSLSHLALEGATRPFPPSPGAELRAARIESSFRQAEGVQWLQDAHERLDTHMDRLRTRNAELSYNINTAQLLDMKHKQLSEEMGALEQEKEAAELSQFEKSRQRAELREKVLQLEKDVQQMRSSLGRGSNDQPAERTPGSLSRTLPLSQEDLNKHERQKGDTELCRLREALRDAETRAKAQEEERNQALQKLQASTETQKTLLNQIEEMNQKLSQTKENHSEMQEQLSDANNRISQACLEKAILSTQVLKLEDNVRELKAKLTGALSDKDQLIKLIHELEIMKEKLRTSQSQLQEATAERATNSKQITDLEAERSQLIRDKDQLLSKLNEGGHEELTKMKEKCCQLRESVEVLELEKQNLQDQCLCLESEVLETEDKQHLREEEHRKQDAAKLKRIEELKAVASHWAEKWQKVALTLQSTQKELDELKKNNSKDKLQAEAVRLATENDKLHKDGQKDKEEIEKLRQHKANMETVLTRAKTESDSLLRVELDACKQELELERSRSRALLHRHKDKGGEASVHTEDTGTQTDLSESSLLWKPPSDSHSSQNKTPQVCLQSSEVQRLKQKLSDREKELREKDEALKSLERLRETEKHEAQLKISALKLKASEDDQDKGGLANVSTTDSLRAPLEESRRRVKQQQEETPTVQKLQTLRQRYPVKDEKPAVCPVSVETDQQRRMITEQLKSLFKEREGKEVGKIDNRPAAGQTGASSLQDWSHTSRAARNSADRRSWHQQGSGLMPVFEEDEEGSDWPAEEAQSEENFHKQSQQMSAMNAEIYNLRAKNENLLPAILRPKQPTQDKSPHSSDETDLPQKTPPLLCPDGIFMAELVDICSPDEDEEEGEDK